jgi:hypothetical protein
MGNGLKTRFWQSNLGRSAVMNRAMADGKRSAKQLAEWLVDMHGDRGQGQALKFYLELADPEGKARQPEFDMSEAAITYLDSVGVGRNGYQPKKVNRRRYRTYYARDFAVTAKGMSSLPKVLDVVERRQERQSSDDFPVPQSWPALNSMKNRYRRASASSSLRNVHRWIATLNRRLRAPCVSACSRRSSLYCLATSGSRSSQAVKTAKLSVEGYDFTFVVKEVEAKC